MATKRRRFSAQFKAKVATEALRGRTYDPGDCGQVPSASEPGLRVEAASAGGA